MHAVRQKIILLIRKEVKRSVKTQYECRIRPGSVTYHFGMPLIGTREFDS